MTYERDRIDVAIRITSPNDALDEEARMGARIKVVGVGGGGSNAVDLGGFDRLDIMRFDVASQSTVTVGLSGPPSVR